MGSTYNLYNLEAPFRNYLLAENISPVSLKNYLSDFRHFLGWLQQQKVIVGPSQSVISHQQLVSYINLDVVRQYRHYLISASLPSTTINRRLSTLRRFCSFCVSQQWLTENPAKHLKNVEAEYESSGFSLNEFRSYLATLDLGSTDVDSISKDIESYLIINSQKI